MFYFFGILATWIYLTQESSEKPTNRKDLIYACCVSLVWPVMAVGLAFYYSNEIGSNLAELLGFNYELPLEFYEEVLSAEENDDFDLGQVVR